MQGNQDETAAYWSNLFHGQLGKGFTRTVKRTFNDLKFGRVKFTGLWKLLAPSLSFCTNGFPFIGFNCSGQFTGQDELEPGVGTQNFQLFPRLPMC